MQGPWVAAPAAALLCCLLATAAPGRCDALEISPVRLDIAARGTAIVTLRNNGAAPVSIQAEAFDWRQDAGGADRLEPTRDLLVVPPLFTLAPGEDQLVRVAFVGQAAETERPFRLVFAELPPPQPVALPRGLAVRLRLSIPAFIAATGPADPALRVADFRQDGSATQLLLVNEGERHVRVHRVDYEQDGGHGKALDVAHYLLPGSRWQVEQTLADAAPVRQVRVVADGGAALEHGVP